MPAPIQASAGDPVMLVKGSTPTVPAACPSTGPGAATAKRKGTRKNARIELETKHAVYNPPYTEMQRLSKRLKT